MWLIHKRALHIPLHCYPGSYHSRLQVGMLCAHAGRGHLTEVESRALHTLVPQAHHWFAETGATTHLVHTCRRHRVTNVTPPSMLLLPPGSLCSLAASFSHMCSHRKCLDAVSTRAHSDRPTLPSLACGNGCMPSLPVSAGLWEGRAGPAPSCLCGAHSCSAASSGNTSCNPEKICTRTARKAAKSLCLRWSLQPKSSRRPVGRVGWAGWGGQPQHSS